MSLHVADVEAKFGYDAHEPDELTIRRGDIIKNCYIVQDMWMEGELYGKRGKFFYSFVSIKKIYNPPPPPPLPGML